MPGRGHSLTIDAGWRKVAGKALEFVKAVHLIAMSREAPSVHGGAV